MLCNNQLVYKCQHQGEANHGTIVSSFHEIKVRIGVICALWLSASAVYVDLKQSFKFLRNELINENTLQY